MAISARNQLAGKVTSIQTGGVMAEVEVAVGDHQIVSVITRRSVEDLDLEIGDDVTVVIKSTEVMLSK
jgi:molybdopterin-binding protein